VAPGKYRLRVFVGTDPVTGSLRQITRIVQAKTQRQAQQILDALRDDVATAEPTGNTATARSLIEGVEIPQHTLDVLAASKSAGS
jgi:hypothetical protein